MVGSFAVSEENCRMPLEMWKFFCGRLTLSFSLLYRIRAWDEEEKAWTITLC
jgi:hypothetical protein